MYISPKQLNLQASGMYTITLANPLEYDYEEIGTKGTQLPGPHGEVITGPDCVLSSCDGLTWEVRKAGANGGCEQFSKNGNILSRNLDRFSRLIPCGS